MALSKSWIYQNTNQSKIPSRISPSINLLILRCSKTQRTQLWDPTNAIAFWTISQARALTLLLRRTFHISPNCVLRSPITSWAIGSSLTSTTIWALLLHSPKQPKERQFTSMSTQNNWSTLIRSFPGPVKSGLICVIITMPITWRKPSLSTSS